VVWWNRQSVNLDPCVAYHRVAPYADDYFGWVACDSRTTRSVVKVLREDFGIPRKSIKAQAYWVA